MDKLVPLIASGLGQIGQAFVSEEGKVRSVKLNPLEAKSFSRVMDCFTYTYETLPKPHVIMKPIEVRNAAEEP